MSIPSSGSAAVRSNSAERDSHGFLAMPASRAPQASATWQQVLKQAIRDPEELCRLLDLAELAPQAGRAAQDFPLFVPRGFLARMRRGDARDPLLRQVLPLDEELTAPGISSGDASHEAIYSSDPVGDGPATLSHGLLQKYRSRALIVATGACAVHCRYCFRRAFPYGESPRSPADWQPAIDLIAADASLREVILSGGDPLTLVDTHLAELARRISAVGHIRRLRIHTRLPIMIPERVTDELLRWLTGGRLTPIVVLHANHPAELADDVAGAIGRLADAGIPLLNQAVLLRGVNDDADTLTDLCERLVDLRVMPYYLHQLDRVLGAAHFEVPVAEGRDLMTKLRARLPGYAVPRYVREIPGADGKVPLE
jgi:EF-P beta-lysylation protein EpmB